jgi:hypothetical protein
MRTARPRRRRPDEEGSVTAEAAIVVPIMAAFALALVWLITVGIAQVRAVDAARDAARELARGDDVAAATSAARRTAPADAHVFVDRRGDDVVVTVTFRAAPPGWLLVPAPSMDVHASAVVAAEMDGPS